MKKSVKNMTCLMACMVGFGLMNVDAATLLVKDATTSAGASGEVSIELKDTDLTEYSEIHFGLSSSDASHVILESPQFNTGIGFSPIGDNLYKISAVGNNGFTDGSTIGTVKFKTTNDLTAGFKITPVNVTFYKKDGTEVAPNTGGVLVREGNVKFEAPKSDVASLSSLTVSQGTLTPAFSSDVTEYNVQVRDTINSIRLSAQAESNGTVSGLGAKTLSMGDNKFEITVTSEDGSNTKTYTINVLRGEIAEPSAYLKSLEINNIGIELSPAFDAKNNKYTVTVGEEIDSLTFKYDTEDPLAKVVIEGNENFLVGENLVKIKVTSSAEEKPEEQIYEITVIKEIEDSEEESVMDIKEDNPKKKVNVWLIVGIVAGVLAIAGGVTFVLFKKKKNNKKDDKGNGNTTAKKKLSLMEDDEDEETLDDETTEEDNEENDDVEDDTIGYQSTTTTLSRTSRLAKRDNESVTDILKGELFEDEKTRQFDSHAFREIVDDPNDEDDKTKEFNFRDFE